MLHSIHILELLSIIDLKSKMEQAEKVIGAKLRRLRHQMGMYTVKDLVMVNLDQHATEIKEREQILDNVIADIETLLEDFSSELGEDKTAAYQNKISAVEQDFLVYRKSFESRLMELKSTPSMNSPVSLETKPYQYPFKLDKMQPKGRSKLSLRPSWKIWSL